MQLTYDVGRNEAEVGTGRLQEQHTEDERCRQKLRDNNHPHPAVGADPADHAIRDEPAEQHPYRAGHHRDPGHVGADLGGRLADALEVGLGAVRPDVAGGVSDGAGQTEQEQ